MSKLLKCFDVKVDNLYFLKDIDCFEKTEDQKIPSSNSSHHDENQIIESDYKYGSTLYANKIIEDAKKEAQNIRLLTIADMKNELEIAQNNGYLKGLQLGKEEALAENQKVLSELKSLLNTLDIQKNIILTRYEDQIKDLAISIAKKIINIELEADDSAFINIYKSSVKDFNNVEWLKISVSEYEIEFATTNADLLMSMVKGAKYIDIIKLDGAPRGTCIVETSQGIVNSSIEIQLNRIVEAFSNIEIVTQKSAE